MLKKRLIPKLQLNFRETTRGIKPILVLTKQFNNPRAIGSPLSQAKIYEAQLADELFLLDLTRTESSWNPFLSILDEISFELATPLSAGGGINSFEQVQELLERGADKVILNSGAVKKPDLIDKVSNNYGSQCVVVCIDFKTDPNNDIKKVFINSGKEETNLDPLKWAKEAVKRGAGEILLNSIDNDGMGNGLDLEITKFISAKIQAPLIISGGCGLSKHFVEGYMSGASAVSAGTFFCQRDQNPMQCRSQISNAGVSIRMGF